MWGVRIRVRLGIPILFLNYTDGRFPAGTVPGLYACCNASKQGLQKMQPFIRASATMLTYEIVTLPSKKKTIRNKTS